MRTLRQTVELSRTWVEHPTSRPRLDFMWRGIAAGFGNKDLAPLFEMYIGNGV